MARPRIAFFACGGTISNVAPGARGRRGLGAHAILASAAAASELASIEAHDFSTGGTIGLGPGGMLALAREVEAALSSGCAGVVVSHGTDTLEEVAYALALMLSRGKPVVLTGAVRAPSHLGSDGAANLLASVRVATSPNAAGLGSVVVLNDEIHAARFATKSHTTRASAFASPGAGPLGEVVENRADVWWEPAWIDELGMPESLDGIEVEIVRVAAGISETSMRAVAASAPAAVVIEGLGGGHLESALLPALDALVSAGIPVVVASRSAAGSTLERTYAISGGELDLVERGALPAGRLAGHKARLRLLVGLALGRSPRELFPVR